MDIYLCVVAVAPLHSMYFVNIPGLTKNHQQTEPSEPGIECRAKAQKHPPPVLVDGTVDAPHDTTEPPKVGDNHERDDDEKDILGTPGDAPCGEDQVVENMCGHQDGKVEHRESAC